MVNQLREVIILAGGLGTRLQEQVRDRPKVLALVNGRAFIEYILDHLLSLNFQRIILAVGFQKELVKNHFKNGYKNLEIIFSEEQNPLGTGGAIIKAFEKVRSSKVLVLNGDSFCDFNLNDVETNISPAIFTYELDDCSRFGKVIIDDKGDLVEFSEKTSQGAGLINAGVYILGKDDLASFPKDTNLSFEKDIIPKLMLRKKIKVYQIKNKSFIDIGTPSDYQKSQKMF